MAMFWLNVLTLLALAGNAATQDPVSIDLSSCGSSKGCLTFPVGCTDTDCIKLVSWKSGPGDSMEFELQTRDMDAEYIAFGLSKSGKMDDTYVLACINGATTVMKQYYNTGYKPSLLADPSVGLTLVASTSSADGVYCKFQRLLTVTGDNQAFPLDAEYSLILVMGGVQAESIKYHMADTPGVSSGKVNVATSLDWVGGSANQSTLKKAHGSIMIAAWILTAALGILSARYMKTAWPDRTIANLAVWFQIHRFCMILTLLMNTIAFIIIFVDVEGWSEFPEGTANFKKAHPIIGVIISALTIINPIMALCRPGPTAKNRPIFNWFHWAVGSGAFILAMINIYFGMMLPSSGFTPVTARYLFIAFLALYSLTQIVLEINKCCGDRKKSDGDDAIEMQAHGAGRGIAEKKTPYLTARYCIMVFYLLGTIGLFVGIIVLIVVV